MFNIFGMLVALLIAESARGTGALGGWIPPAAAAVAVAAVTVFLYSLASHAAERLQLSRLQVQAALARAVPGADQMAEQDARQREALGRYLPMLRLGADAVVLTVYLALATYFGWVDYVAQTWGVPRHLDILPNLLPYLALLAGSWLAQVRLENALHGPAWRPWGFVMFQVRANAMTIAPIVLVNAAYWAVLAYVPLVKDVREAFLYSEFVLMLALVLPVFLLMPLVVRAALRTRPLPDGPLRRKLEDFARRHNLRTGGLYVWETGSRHFTTAFVIGLVGPLRFVFFTDALLRRFDDNEILAVFAHEMGHVRHRHLWWLLAFILSFSVLLLGAEALGAMLASPGAPLALVVGLVVYAYAVFGYVSRRFERQADDYAATHTSPELMAGVLLKIAQANPAALNRTGWRHFSIRQRVAELALVHHRPQVRALFDAQRRRAMLLVAAVTLGALAALAKPVREDVVSGFATLALAQFDQARLNNAPSDTLDTLAERTIRRAEAMARLDREYELAALQYRGVVETLSGRPTDALEQMAGRAREFEAAAETDAERRKWQDYALSAEATAVATQRAKAKGTPWLDEFREELRKHGRQVR
ncbi:MAG: M48 family metalloprotease [Planctomycetes bacterium]|jgi:Zn-dependent protease with chaperone function|nr:M48 family metalloprotease [Planctomycetota bacterium]MCL4730629.1 M48 family metalloprotease [Planctomycetota bacterium]